jgi:hypothetical protein
MTIINTGHINSQLNRLSSPFDGEEIIGLAETTRDVIKTAQSSGVRAVVCASISESALTYIASEYTPKPATLDLTKNLSLNIGTIRSLEQPVLIDVVNKRVVFRGILYLKFSSKLTRSADAAFVQVLVEVIANPVLAQSAISSFQLQVEKCRILDAPEIIISDFDLLKDDYKDQADFEAGAKSIIDEIVNLNLPYDLVLPTYLARMPLPDHWEQIEGYRLNFLKLDYRSCTSPSGGIDNNIFLTFGVQSLNIPSPCICSNSSASLFPSPLKTLEREVWLSLGFSQEALNEIVSPLVNIGFTDTYKKGGVLFGLARYWVKSILRELKITDNSLRGSVSCEGGGEVKAGISDKCGKEVAASTKLILNISDVVINWEIVESVKSGGRGGNPRRNIQLDCKPTAKVGSIDVTFDNNNFPLDQIVSYVYSHIAELGRARLSKAIESVLSFALLRSSTDTTDGGFLGVIKAGEPRFFENDCLVLLLKPVLGVFE